MNEQNKSAILIDGHCYVHVSVNVTRYDIAKYSCRHFPPEHAVGHLAIIRSNRIRDKLLKGPIANRAYYIGLENRKIYMLETNEEHFAWYWAYGSENEFLSESFEVWQYRSLNEQVAYPQDKRGFGIFHVRGSDSDKTWRFEAVTEDDQPQNGVGFLCEYEPSHSAKTHATSVLIMIATVLSYFNMRL